MNGFDTTIENVFTPNEMEYVIHCYKNKLNPAVVFGSSGGNTEVDKQIRDASGYFIPDYNVIVERFKNITSSITGIPVSHQEKPNFIKYKKGGFYKAHFDGFNDGESGKQKMNPDGQRMFTSILYLNDDFEGGETFPGKIYIWRNASDDLKLDPKSLHGGHPVDSGVKYIIVIWTRSNSLA
jgi:prolyl 4-hydroxylase